MKNIVAVFCLFSLLGLASCEKDEGKLPAISFKTGASYTSTDVSLAVGSSFTIGIDAAKTEDKDVLKRFNISKSINGGAATSELTQSLTGTEGDTFSYDFTGTVDNVVGQQTKYTFTVTNRDGLTNQVSLTITGQ